MVERQPSKLKVEGSSPFYRSISRRRVHVISPTCLKDISAQSVHSLENKLSNLDKAFSYVYSILFTWNFSSSIVWNGCDVSNWRIRWIRWIRHRCLWLSISFYFLLANYGYCNIRFWNKANDWTCNRHVLCKKE